MRIILFIMISFIIGISEDTFSDTKTGLMWQDTLEWEFLDGYDYVNEYNDKTVTTRDLTKDWRSAKSYCKDLIIGKYDDWRLPNYHELLSIVDYHSSPAIKQGFKNVSRSYYWSSSQYGRLSNEIWKIDFYNGYTNSENKLTKLYVRCVRDRQ